MILKIPIHSVTDLITNSSTVIFTYSEGSEHAVKDMVTEFFKTFGINKTCDEVFDTVVVCGDSDRYSEYISELDEVELPFGITKETDIEKLYDKVVFGEMKKPDWFKTVEEMEDGWSYFTPSTYLYLIPKSPEYKDFTTLIRNFLYSTDHEATRDG